MISSPRCLGLYLSPYFPSSSYLQKFETFRTFPPRFSFPIFPNFPNRAGLPCVSWIVRLQGKSPYIWKQCIDSDVRIIIAKICRVTTYHSESNLMEASKKRFWTNLILRLLFWKFKLSNECMILYLNILRIIIE